jgi:hypothetical protein
MNRMIARLLAGLSLSLALSAVSLAAEKAPDNRPADPAAACAHMMQDPGITEQGKKSMQEFMQSPRAPEAMANMMAMARRMGNGDVMLGMTKMMEMMGSMGGGGMMGGQGSMMQPGKPSGK